MTDTYLQRSTTSLPLRIWSIGAIFVLFQFFLQLSSGVVIGKIMHEMDLSALEAGLLSSAFYIVYTGLQIPVGVLLDRYNSRYLLTFTALICSIGCLLFSVSMTFWGLIFGRFLIGCGSAFAFVGLTHLVRQYFPPHRFAFMIGISETLGLTATVIGIIGLGSFIATSGWRPFIKDAALIGFLISLLCWRYIPNDAQNSCSKKILQQLKPILSNLKIWNNGLFIAFTFAIVTVFGALWSVPFIQAKLGCTLRIASFINALFFLGTGLSCPLFGYLDSKLKHRRYVIIFACLLTAGLFLLILYLPTQQISLIAGLMFLLGLCCGSYILSYPIANELAPPGGLSTCTGFINTLAVITTPILQTLVGYFLDLVSNDHRYTINEFQIALLILPVILLISCVFAFFLPDHTHRES